MFAFAPNGWLSLLPAGCIVTAAGDLRLQAAGKGAPAPDPLDPVGRIHIPIGIANTLDTLKTFVEAEGCFSPGVGSYGIYFWVYDTDARKLTAPTMPDVPVKHGLPDGAYLIPWSSWSAGKVNVRTEVCHVRVPACRTDAHVVGARVHLANTGASRRRLHLYAALRPLGPAGWPVKALAVAEGGNALLVDGRTALLCGAEGVCGGVAATDTIGEFASRGELPRDSTAASEKGDCSGALRAAVTVPPGKTVTLGLLCPVLPRGTPRVQIGFSAAGAE